MIHFSQEACAKLIQRRKGEIVPVVYEKLGRLLSAHPEVNKVWLIGSYANGDWNDEDTPLWFRQYRERIGKKPGYSDVDFITEPYVEPDYEHYDIQPGGRAGKILIYDNTNTKL